MGEQRRTQTKTSTFAASTRFHVAVVLTDPILFSENLSCVAPQDGEWKKEDEETSVKGGVSKSSAQSNYERYKC